MVAGGRELIDTLWNVNVEEFTSQLPDVEGINRYIMECKWIDETKAQYGISDGINRYIMECK